MKSIIVRACAITAALIALVSPGAFALPIDPGIAGNTGVSGNLADTPGNGFVIEIDYGFATGVNGFGTEPIGSGGMKREPVVAGLFAVSAGEGAVQGSYLDPSTLCMTASGLEAAGTAGIMSDEHLCRTGEFRTPMPVPGTMLVLGLGLLGLSCLKRRGPRTMPPARSEDRGFFPARALTAHAYAAEGKAQVVPITAALNQKTPSRVTEKYRAVMKMKHQGSELRKEMAG